MTPAFQEIAKETKNAMTTYKMEIGPSTEKLLKGIADFGTREEIREKLRDIIRGMSANASTEKMRDSLLKLQEIFRIKGEEKTNEFGITYSKEEQKRKFDVDASIETRNACCVSLNIALARTISEMFDATRIKANVEMVRVVGDQDYTGKAGVESHVIVKVSYIGQTWYFDASNTTDTETLKINQLDENRAVSNVGQPYYLGQTFSIAEMMVYGKVLDDIRSGKPISSGAALSLNRNLIPLLGNTSIENRVHILQTNPNWKEIIENEKNMETRLMLSCDLMQYYNAKEDKKMALYFAEVVLDSTTKLGNKINATDVAPWINGVMGAYLLLRENGKSPQDLNWLVKVTFYSITNRDVVKYVSDESRDALNIMYNDVQNLKMDKNMEYFMLASAWRIKNVENKQCSTELLSATDKIIERGEKTFYIDPRYKELRIGEQLIVIQLAAANGGAIKDVSLRLTPRERERYAYYIKSE